MLVNLRRVKSIFRIMPIAISSIFAACVFQVKDTQQEGHTKLTQELTGGWSQTCDSNSMNDCRLDMCIYGRDSIVMVARSKGKLKHNLDIHCSVSDFSILFVQRYHDLKYEGDSLYLRSGNLQQYVSRLAGPGHCYTGGPVYSNPMEQISASTPYSVNGDTLVFSNMGFETDSMIDQYELIEEKKNFIPERRILIRNDSIRESLCK